MVGTSPRRASVARPHVARRSTARPRWRLPSSWHRAPSIITVLERLDDDPVLFCDCAESATHTCG